MMRISPLSFLSSDMAMPVGGCGALLSSPMRAGVKNFAIKGKHQPQNPNIHGWNPTDDTPGVFTSSVVHSKDGVLDSWFQDAIQEKEAAARMASLLVQLPLERWGEALSSLIRVANKHLVERMTDCLGLRDRAVLVLALAVVARPLLAGGCWDPKLPVGIPEAGSRRNLVAPLSWRIAAVGNDIVASRVARAQIIQWQFATAEAEEKSLPGTWIDRRV